MIEVIWVAVFGAALAWLQAHSTDPDPIELPVEDEWTRWEDEIHNWREGA